MTPAVAHGVGEKVHMWTRPRPVFTRWIAQAGWTRHQAKICGWSSILQVTQRVNGAPMRMPAPAGSMTCVLHALRWLRFRQTVALLRPHEAAALVVCKWEMPAPKLHKGVRASRVETPKCRGPRPR